jgi:ATP-dependent RNA helicase DeaD
MDVGRDGNADPKWLLPFLCRRGHVTRAEIGRIRILPNKDGGIGVDVERNDTTFVKSDEPPAPAAPASEERPRRSRRKTDRKPRDDDDNDDG